MSSNIILNKQNITNQGNNKLKYNFPNTVTFGKNDKIAISHLSIFYSWFNISAKNKNNFFQYKWWDMNGDLTVIVPVTIKDGYYTVDTLYEFLQGVMVSNGHYLETLPVGGNISYIYFIEFLTNATYYSIETRLSSVSTQMDFGTGLKAYTDFCQVPTTWAVPSTFQTPQVIFPSNNNFKDLMGFEGTIAQDTTGDTTNKKYSFLNTSVPTMEPSSSFIITCSLVTNDFGIPNNIIHSFTIPKGVSFGDSINPVNEVVYSKIKEGTYKDLTLSIYDQNFDELQILDNNMLITLSIVQDINNNI